ncbi:hemK methyltransferase family member 1 [Ooceraea biroi]|uniref:peptide chain release factor N(5)-glutamine methyltransferase n=1 Tax=Ooceraea biroi TaxID=2015173 RepID=A0A026VSY3_OOCBI|nr:hemK methyltransferase family member 1 [Ooceraea biroi]EZA46842.1 HemK methyltransferase family member [Ooceraea biroi]
MWCRNILRTRAIINNSATPIGLQRLAKNQRHPNDIMSGHSIRLTSTARECTIGDAIDNWSHRFESEGVPEPVESIKHILAHIIGTKKIMDIRDVRNNRLNGSQFEKLESLCKYRLLRMPIEYIIGEWTFRDITVKLVPPIFIPCPETEMLVDIVLKRLNSLQVENCEMLEIGCGSGAISLSLAHACKKIKCTSIDMNLHACELTTTNRNNLNLVDQITVMHATLTPESNIEISSILDGTGNVDLNSKLFDFVVSNPPYELREEISRLPEIRTYQDYRARDGGDDGLKVIKPLLKYVAKVLKPGGRIFMEVDPKHPEHIRHFTNKYSDLKLRHEHTYKDFGNKDRFVELVKVT